MFGLIRWILDLTDNSNLDVNVKESGSQAIEAAERGQEIDEDDYGIEEEEFGIQSDAEPARVEQVVRKLKI